MRREDGDCERDRGASSSEGVECAVAELACKARSTFRLRRYRAEDRVLAFQREISRVIVRCLTSASWRAARASSSSGSRRRRRSFISMSFSRPFRLLPRRQNMHPIMKTQTQMARARESARMRVVLLDDARAVGFQPLGRVSSRWVDASAMSADDAAEDVADAVEDDVGDTENFVSSSRYVLVAEVQLCGACQTFLVQDDSERADAPLRREASNRPFSTPRLRPPRTCLGSCGRLFACCCCCACGVV